ncbi:MAG: protein kinase [Pseudomonadota bacterium]|nr:protein kinase [Pseudomonadota bacterium]
MEVVIPGYKIVKVIGKGGMATVYLAVQESFNRQVALKIMARHLMGDEVFSERFFREARIIASLNHRNIVPVFDVGRAGAHHYLSMEYLPGGDLKQRLKQGIRAEEALHVIYEIATALAYAHSKSYIHRDIKPENILFREDNTVVLTDFGIAKALDTSDCNMTSTGMIVGSPHYMSPEQALAREIDIRSDIYSLGVVFYEVLVGKPLYDANSSVAAAIKHISEPIPKLPETFSYLQPLLEKMVAKAPEDRYQSAGEVAFALEPYLRAAPENWNTVVLEEFVSETEGGTRIIVPATGQHRAAVATPAPMPTGRHAAAAAPTLHGDAASAKLSKLSSRVSEAAIQVEHKIEARLSNLRSGILADRRKQGAAAAVVLLLVGAGLTLSNRGEDELPAPSQPVAQTPVMAPAPASDAAPSKQPDPALRIAQAGDTPPPSEAPQTSTQVFNKQVSKKPESQKQESEAQQRTQQLTQKQLEKPAIKTPAIKTPAPNAQEPNAPAALESTAQASGQGNSGDVLASYLDDLDTSAGSATPPEQTAHLDLAADTALDSATTEPPLEQSAPDTITDVAQSLEQPPQPDEQEGRSAVGIIATAEAAPEEQNEEQQTMQLALLETAPTRSSDTEPGLMQDDGSGSASGELEILLQQAREALRRDRLMLPKKTSAYTLYLQALELNPTNPEARQGLDRIVAKYLVLASRQLNEGELDQAQEYADRAGAVAALDAVSAEQKQEVGRMQSTIERVRYLEVMEQLETWISVVKQKQNLTPDDLNSAYESYMSVLNNNYRDPKVNVAHEVYANAFFTLGKRYFKSDDLEISGDLIAKGLEINPEHENLQDLNARWERKKNGDEWFMDRFY